MLDHDFKLALVSLPDKKAQAAFQKLVVKNAAVIQAVTYYYEHGRKYLLLLSKPAALQFVTGLQIKVEPIRSYLGSSNRLVQLLLNRESGTALTSQKQNLTSALYVAQTKWQRTIQSQGLQQRYTLRIQLEADHNLAITTQTFTQERQPKADHELYFWDAKRNLMCRCYQKTDFKQKVLFHRGNGTLHKNLVDYFSLADLDHFNQTKTGVIAVLKTNLAKHAHQYFKRPLQFVPVPLLADYKEKLPQKETIWHYFQGQPLNVYCESDDPLAVTLSRRIAEGLEKSPLIQTAQITVQSNQCAQPGNNIQVLRDARRKGVVEQYQAGDQDTIIQHVTLENFGQLDHKTGLLKWEPPKDAGKDNQMIKVGQELAIRHDLTEKHLQLPAAELQMLASRYRYYRCEWIPKAKPAAIMLTKMEISAAGRIKLKNQRFELEPLAAWDELACLNVYLQHLNPAKQNYQQQFFWDQIEGILSDGTHVVLIQKTAYQIMPQVNEVQQLLSKSDPDKFLVTDSVITILTKLMESSAEPRYRATCSQMIASIKQLNKAAFSIGEGNQAFKQSGISFYGKPYKMICLNLEANETFTFHNSLRQKVRAPLLKGTLGMGLVNIQGRFYYYVGSYQALKPKVARAVRLRQLVTLAGNNDDSRYALFADLSELMSVEFVRNGQYTVVPFPFKYLREYWRHLQRQKMV